jgi:hypothetical protein
VRYQLAPMDLRESGHLPPPSLALAGRSDPLIADDACARLHVSSGSRGRLCGSEPIHVWRHARAWLILNHMNSATFTPQTCDGLVGRQSTSGLF